MIKNYPGAVALVTALFLSALATCWFAIWWFLGARELQALEFRYQSMNQVSAAVQALANDAMEFSRRNPAIDPLLQQFDLKPKVASALNPVAPVAPAVPTAPKPR